MGLPGTGQSHNLPAPRPKLGECVVLHLRSAGRQELTRRIQRAMHLGNTLTVQHPEGQVDKMHSQIHHATTTGLAAIVEPILVRPVSIMKLKIDGKDLTEFSAAKDVVDDADPPGFPVGEIDTDQPGCRARCRQNGGHLSRVAAQGLLAEHGDAPLQYLDCLRSVHGTWRGNHYTVRFKGKEFVHRFHCRSFRR